MSKSRSFSIYLLKEDFNVTNTLKDDHRLDDGIEGNALPDDAVLYVLDNQPTPPWWKSYFGIQKNLTQTLKGAIVFLPVEGRTFAITFGHVFHNLKSESCEYDFGLRVTLNSVDPDKLKSFDSLRPENARRQRTQLSVGSDLTLFDFDRDGTILKSLTGKVKEELMTFFRHATGASSIRISSDVTPVGLLGLCGKLLELYQDETCKISFPDIQNVTPIKDPVVIDALNAKLVDAVRTKDESLVLTIPDIVNYADEMYATFTGEGAGLVYDDVYIDCYYEYLEQSRFNLAIIDELTAVQCRKVAAVLSDLPEGETPLAPSLPGGGSAVAGPARRDRRGRRDLRARKPQGRAEPEPQATPPRRQGAQARPVARAGADPGRRRSWWRDPQPHPAEARRGQREAGAGAGDRPGRPARLRRRSLPSPRRPGAWHSSPERQPLRRRAGARLGDRTPAGPEPIPRDRSRPVTRVPAGACGYLLATR